MSAPGPLEAQRQMVERLQDPARYPHPVTSVSVIETHISFVLLTGPFAYKIKKAVDLGFVDYTSPARRRFCCEEELRLNRRLAPDIYLGVAPIGGTWADPHWDGAEAIDFAVKMRQFDPADRLDAVLAQGRLRPGHVDALAAAIARFHASVPAAAPDTDHGRADIVWAQVAAVLDRLQALAAPAERPRVAALDAWCRAEHQRLRPKFDARKAAGFVRECHGDLHLGNIVRVDDTPVVFDCIEFDPALRWIDIVADLAFLVMDLAERGRPDFAWRVVNAWLEPLGDYGGLAVLRFYRVYRALVRAMVAALSGADADARRYLDHAADTTMPTPPRLLVTHGLAGSGKSTVARALAQALGAVQLRSDVERKRLHGLAPLTRSGSALDAGLYGDPETRATYARLTELATGALAAGYPVIIDAACLRRWQREGFRRLARARGIPCVIVDCQAPAAELERRVVSRSAGGADASEATLAVLAGQRRTAEPLDADERVMAVVVDTTRTEVDDLLARIQRLSEAHRPLPP
ncbi:AAA family ATPase [Nitrogeniibacter mangrovi]|uniref:AAA family ATPase n=1 Tax=Nitrogeniibacter mangrovi TaxID=2016596 RepID=A0A6C1B396_9RHOO|nr:bifunctional aminoglycoside phosphotransferase/ATP-binding protein [Nitrogeniibacter mangrovi]QID16800.1 AAA family ATPase [Nitrogeniibacter mangrovi]